MKQRWIAKHTIIDGRRCKFIAHGGSLIDLWIKWLLHLFVTLGIYGFWLAPNLKRWIVTHTDFER